MATHIYVYIQPHVQATMIMVMVMAMHINAYEKCVKWISSKIMLSDLKHFNENKTQEK